MEFKDKKRKKLLIPGIIIIGILLCTPVALGIYLNDIEDVNTDTALTCNILHYDGVNWTNWDLWNETITWYKPHTFNDIVTSQAYYGDGGNLTNITGSGDGYSGDMGHPHNQDLNDTDTVSFDKVLYSGSDEFNIDSGTYNLNIGTSAFAKYPLIIHNTGETTKPYESASRVRLTNNQNVNSGFWTRLNLATETYDQNNDFAFYRFVAPHTGLYHISYSVQASTLALGSDLYAGIYKNGNLAGGYSVDGYCSGVMSLSGSDILDLNANDYIELYVRHTSGLGVTFGASVYTNYISICKIA